MIELLRTNNPVTISFTEALLRDAGIRYVWMDLHMSILEGSIGVLPKRLMVPNEDAEQTRQLLRDADIDVPPVGESRW